MDMFKKNKVSLWSYMHMNQIQMILLYSYIKKLKKTRVRTGMYFILSDNNRM